jgi:hypothetical protein
METLSDNFVTLIQIAKTRTTPTIPRLVDWLNAIIGQFYKLLDVSERVNSRIGTYDYTNLLSKHSNI